MLNQVSCLAIVGGFISMVIPFATAAGSAPNSIKIFPPGTEPNGLPYPEHIKNYWKWLLSIPGDVNPVNDPTGSTCATGQLSSNSSVFYLVSTPGGKSFSVADRICKVPFGKGLFIPVTQVEISQKESPTIKTDQGLVDEAKSDQDDVRFASLKIDGKQYMLNELDKFRTQTGAFDVFFKGPKPLYGVDEGASRAAADGRYIITEPLPKGNHTIQFNNSYDPTKTPLAQDVTYRIIVE